MIEIIGMFILGVLVAIFGTRILNRKDKENEIRKKDVDSIIDDDLSNGNELRTEIKKGKDSFLDKVDSYLKNFK